MRLLLTGGTGFVAGAFLRRVLLEDGVQVWLLVRPGSPKAPRLESLLHEYPDRLRLTSADLRNAGATRDVVGECRPHRVIHLASAGVTNPNLPIPDALETNLQGTLNLIEACLDAPQPPQQLVVARTPGEINAMNVYAASKAAAWSFCLMAANTRRLPVAGAMIFQAYGPGQAGNTLIPSAAAAALAGHDLPMTSGQQLRDWIHVDDAAAGLIAMLRTDLPPGSSVDLGTGRATSVAEVVSLIYRLAGAGGKPLIGALPNRSGEDRRQVADAAASRKLIGWGAEISLEDGVARLLDSLR